MRIGIQTWGCEGDIRPLLALSHGLSHQGHEVRLGYTSTQEKDYKPIASQLGVQVFAEKKESLFSQSYSRWVLAEQLAVDSDLLIAQSFALPLMVAAMKHEKPFVILDLFPRFPSGAYIPLEFYWLRACGNLGLWTWVNRVAWWFTLKGRNFYFHPLLQALCRYADIPTLSMSELPQRAALQLLAASPLLFPRPADWPENAHVCGHFDLPEKDSGHRLPDGLTDFISTGSPPVFVTCGSTPVDKPALERLMFAIRRGGHRGIIQLIENDTEPLPLEGIYLLRGFVPHRAVLPHCSAALHQGGAGTTHAALREGIPSVILAYWVDQPFWGDLLAREGLGPPRLLRRRYRDADLDQAIAMAAGDVRLRRRVSDFGNRLQAEDGVTTAIMLLKEYGLINHTAQGLPSGKNTGPTDKGFKYQYDPT